MPCPYNVDRFAVQYRNRFATQHRNRFVAQERKNVATENIDSVGQTSEIPDLATGVCFPDFTRLPCSLASVPVTL
jgi:hypothetical protein